MSIPVCDQCGVVEDYTHTNEFDNEACDWCGAEVSLLNEDDPRTER